MKNMCKKCIHCQLCSVLDLEKIKRILEHLEGTIHRNLSSTLDSSLQANLNSCKHMDTKSRHPPRKITCHTENNLFDDDSSGISKVSEQSSQNSTQTKSIVSSPDNVDIVKPTKISSAVSTPSKTSSISKNDNINKTPKRKYITSHRKLQPGLTGAKRSRVFVKHNYHDHANDSETDYFKYHLKYLESNKKTHNGNVSQPFPKKLHKLLDEIEDDNLDSIIGWQSHGRSFIIHNKKRFIKEVMPKYFKHSRFASFLRQVNLYGFIRLCSGRDKGAYYHELFLRGMPFLCMKMFPIKRKGTGQKAAGDPDAEPDLFSMPFVNTSWNKCTKNSVKEKNEDSKQSESNICVLDNTSASTVSRESICSSSDDSSLENYNVLNHGTHDQVIPMTINTQESMKQLKPSNFSQEKNVPLDGDVIDQMMREPLLLLDDTEQCRQAHDICESNEAVDEISLNEIVTIFDDKSSLKFEPLHVENGMCYEQLSKLLNTPCPEINPEKANEMGFTYNSEFDIPPSSNNGQFYNDSSSKLVTFDSTLDEDLQINQGIFDSAEHFRGSLDKIFV